jgi:ubiquinone/menaquinone biosynthesis C-methylase UbiE
LTTPRVHEFFNEKAALWSRKYVGAAPLRDRLRTFTQVVREAVPAGDTVLDLGCGAGHLAANLAGAGFQLTGCDVAERMIAEARTRFPSAANWLPLPPDWSRLPFENGRFGAIVASSVFEYLSCPETVLRECQRVLRPGGALIVSVPDTEDVVRRAEAALAPLAPALLLMPSGRARRFGNYLNLSRQRHSVAEWNRLASEAGLSSVGPLAGRTGRLLVLHFRKPD